MTRPTNDRLREELQGNRFKHPGEFIILLVLTACAAVTVLTTVAIVLTLFGETASFFQDVSFVTFFNPRGDWQALIDPRDYAVIELVAGTANVVLWSMVFALPLGLGAAVWLSEYASPRARKTIKPMLEVLAGVPTVVYAFFALTFVTQDVLRPLLGTDNVPIFNALSASLLLAVMVLPTIASVSEDAMANVPQGLREAAYGLGATRLEVAIKVVFPAALSGIVASVLLAVARVVGETMIVAVAAGSQPNLSMWPLDTVQTMTGYMLQVGLGDAARGTPDYDSLFAVGSTLFVITLLLNIAAQVIVTRFREEYD